MKLTSKLTLAFLLVSLIAVGLAALFVWTTTYVQFDQYLVDQRQGQFVAIAAEYYQSQGSWSGVDAVLREQGLLPPFAQPGTQQPDPQPFALVDQNRVVIVPGGQYRPGQKVQKGTLEKGIGIEVGGVVVGTVLTTGQAPTRSPIEDKYLTHVNQSLLVAALGGALIALLLGLFLARSLTHPVRDLTAATVSMAQGRFSQPVPIRSQDELGKLAASFNQMSADLERANRARRQMTADIAHDLRNPLTVLSGYLESLQDGKLQPTPERFEVMQSEVQHLQRLVEDLRTLSLADVGELKLHRQLIAPADLLERVVAAYRHQAESQQIELSVDTQGALAEIELDPERMEQVLGNLVSNALRYTPEGGTIRLSADQAEDRLVLGVEDSGSGILPEVLPHIFERSYRGDPSRSGNESGLGLAIAKSIVELHGGSIYAESASAGTRFTIIL
ncbi:MAG: HAMP domain-containing protein [Chloroflexi bacterium]|nr:HAMP domain-containing protein [Chloroflexota bacterium]